MSDELYLGLISGTSVDGVDVALVRIASGARPTLVHGITVSYPTNLRDGILDMIRDGGADFARFGRADVAIGEAFAAAALQLLARHGIDPREVRAIGSHGQTLWHDPTGVRPFTLQIGDPNVIAARTGVTVVADFRRLDVALGGQGAPLVPPFHAAAFGADNERRAVINLGGIANITVLREDAVLGFDSGPASALLDVWCATHRGIPYDAHGQWARSGTVDEQLLMRLLDEPFLRAEPPKSTGKELYNADYIAAHLKSLGRSLAPADVQATLLELSARSVADALRQHAPGTARALVCGGGGHNSFLLERIRHHLAGLPVETTAQYGIDPDLVEACAFAWLAQRRLAQATTTLAAVTGARRDSVSGAIYASHSDH